MGNGVWQPETLRAVKEQYPCRKQTNSTQWLTFYMYRRQNACFQTSTFVMFWGLVIQSQQAAVWRMLFGLYVPWQQSHIDLIFLCTAINSQMVTSSTETPFTIYPWRMYVHRPLKAQHKEKKRGGMVSVSIEENKAGVPCCTFGVSISFDVIQDRWRIIVESIDRTVRLMEILIFIHTVWQSHLWTKWNWMHIYTGLYLCNSNRVIKGLLSSLSCNVSVFYLVLITFLMPHRD